LFESSVVSAVTWCPADRPNDKNGKMSRLTLFVLLLSATACTHTIRMVPAETQKTCEPTGRALGVQLKFDRLLKEKADGSCTEPKVYAKPGQEAQVRQVFADSLRATGCFSSVTDVDADPNAAVDYVFRAQVARFDACADLHEDDAARRDAAVVAGVFFGLMGGIAVSGDADRRTAAGDALLEDIVLEEKASGAVRWNNGVARGTIRERASKDVPGPYSVADRALALLIRDVAIKASRAIQGRSMYGAIGVEDTKKRRIAIVSKVAEDEETARASMPEDVRPRLQEGFPVLMSTEELGVVREDKKGHALVLAFFTDDEDAVDWLLSLRPPVQGLEMLLLKPR
jgi:hypothetical protein